MTPNFRSTQSDSGGAAGRARLGAALLRLVEPAIPLPAPERRRARLLSGLLLSLIILIVLAFIASALLSTGASPFENPALPVAVGATLLLALAYYLNRRGRFYPAAVFTVLIAAVGAWASIIANRTLVTFQPLTLGFVVISVILASILLPPRVTVVLAAAHVLGVFLFFPDLAIGLIFISFISGLILVSALITQYDLAQINQQTRELADREERFRALIENSSDAISLNAADGTVLYESPAASKIWGRPAEAMIGVQPFERIHPDDRAAARQLLAAILGDPKQTATAQYRVQHQDGSWRWIEITVQNLLANPSVAAIVGNYRDITLRRSAEAALRQSEEQYRHLFESNPHPMWVYDTETLAFLAVNEAACQHYGFTRDEFSAMTIRDIRPPEDLPRLAENLARPAPRLAKTGVWRHRKKDATLIDVEVTSHAITFVGRDARLVLANDVTGRRQAEEALRRSEARYRQLFEASPEIIFTATANGTLTAINPAFDAITGWDRDQWLGRRFDQLLHPDDVPRVAEWFARLNHGLPVGPEDARLTNGAGDNLTVAFTAVPLREADQFAGVMGIVRDVTERRQREIELEAIASLGAALRPAADRAAIAPVLLDQALVLLEAGGAALYVVDRVRREAVVELGRGAWAAMTGLRLKLDEGVNGLVIASGQGYHNDDVRGDPRLARPDLLAGQHAVVGLPLISREQTIGAIWLGRTRPFSQASVRVLAALADMGASAIHRAALHEETERRLQRLTALRAVDIAISASLDVRITLNILLDQAVTHLQADAADILLFHAHSQSLTYAAGRGFRAPAATRAPVHLGEGLAGRAALERSEVYVAHLPKTGPAERRTGRLARDEGFVAYRALPLIAKAELVGILEIYHRSPFEADSEWLDFSQALAGQAAIAIDNAALFESVQRSNAELALAYDTTLEGWSRALDLRDKETEGHSQRVTDMTLRLAAALGMSPAELVHARRGSLLHDIGKMGIPDSILLKPGPLTDEEWVIMRRHPTYAYELLSPIAYLRPALDIPYRHHEKWDGTGYPDGLKGEQIPLAARIFAVADVWDALRSDRPYRAAWPNAEVLAYIRARVGTHFDPRVVEVFLRETKETDA